MLHTLFQDYEAFACHVFTDEKSLQGIFGHFMPLMTKYFLPCHFQPWHTMAKSGYWHIFANHAENIFWIIYQPLITMSNSLFNIIIVIGHTNFVIISHKHQRRNWSYQLKQSSTHAGVCNVSLCVPMMQLSAHRQSQGQGNSVHLIGKNKPSYFAIVLKSQLKFSKC